jgi:hypothetical protein
MTDIISGVKIPDSKIAREGAELVRQYETEMLFNHSVRVFAFGAMRGVRQNLKFDSELLYIAALFTIWASSILITPIQSDSKSMAPTQRANFSGAVASLSQKRNLSGRQLLCTLRPAFLSI